MKRPRAPHVDRAPWANSADSDVSPTQLWILSGQAGIIVAFLAGFDVIHFTPKKASLAVMFFTFLCVMLGPHGRYRKIIINYSVFAMIWWWFMSGFWTVVHYGWWTSIQANIPLFFCVVILAGMLPTRHLVVAILYQCYAVIVFEYFWTATHYTSSTANFDPNGIDTNAGWHGSFIHKNAMAPYLVMVIVAILLLEKRKRVRLTFLGLAGLFITMSNCSTAWATLIIVLAFHAWFEIYVRREGRMKPATMVLSAICGVLLIGVGTMMWQKVVTAGGKDLTFSGRTVIWESAIPAIKAKPWIGYGLGGVFTNLAVEPSRSIITHIGFPIGHAHSSYFQLLLEMGIIGLVLWLMISITTIVTSARLLGYNPAIAQFGILYCLTMLVTSFSETLSGGGWVAVLIIIRALVSREFKHERFNVVGGTPRRRFEAAPASTPNGPPPHLVGVAQ